MKFAVAQACSPAQTNHKSRMSRSRLGWSCVRPAGCVDAQGAARCGSACWRFRSLGFSARPRPTANTASIRRSSPQALRPSRRGPAISSCFARCSGVAANR